MLVGAVVGRCYRITRKHSVGGMGTIYAGEHEELGKPVAIKVLHARVCEKPSAIERFMREARTASGVAHPNVVDVFDLGRLEDGRPFMVMPLLEGMDCERALAQRGPQSPTTVARWLAGAAAGLDALHRRGLVHRDVKPANVFLVQRDDGTEESMIMDFGLAAFQRQGTKLTAKGIVLGTPHYLPPECATGTKADVAGDVYSLAVVAYELVTGTLPFDHDDPAYVMAAKISNIAPSISTRLKGEVPVALDELFTRALSRRPQKRPASCTAFIEALRSAAKDATVENPVVSASSSINPSEPPASRPESKSAPTQAGRSRAQRQIDTEPMPVARGQSSTNHPTRDSVQIPTRTRNLVVPALLVALLLGGSFWLAAPDPSASAGARHTQLELAEHVAVADSVDPAFDSRTMAGDDDTAELADPLEPRGQQRQRRARPVERMDDLHPPIERVEGAPPPAPEAEDHIPTVPAADRARAERLTQEANQLTLRGLLPAAIEKYREATLVAPRHAAAWRGLGIANQRMNRTAEARRAFERYLRMAPDAADASRIQARLATL